MSWLLRLSRFLARTSGIVIDADRLYMIENRLAPLRERLGRISYDELMDRVDGGDRAVAREIVEAMTTNETFFFRDRAPYERFRSVILPYLKQERASSRRIRIWCAACSTGQEPYSLAMILDEEFRHFQGWNVEILATDISQSVIETAQAGIYNQFEVQRGLPVGMLLRYFQKLDENRWQILEHLKERVTFAAFNMLESYAQLGTFDVIFCRNLLIYLDAEKKRDILDRLSRSLADDGYLTLGAAETPMGISQTIVGDPDHPGQFRKRGERMQNTPVLRLVAG